MRHSRSPAKPVVRELELSGLKDGKQVSLLGNDAYERISFISNDLTGRDLSGATFTRCELVGLKAERLQAQGAGFYETRIDGLELPVLEAARSTLRDALLVGIRIGSAALIDVRLNAVVIADSRFERVNLRSSDLRDVIFRNCTFGDMDLRAAALSRVAFENCQVAMLNCEHANLRDADLRGLDISAVLGVDSLAGATMNTPQVTKLASYFAAHLGVRLED